MDIKAENLHQENGTISFDVKVKDQIFSVNLSVPGKYNVYNALAALSVCETMGIDLESACKALSNFSGVKRRFDIKANEDIMIIDDYAHHPVEVQNVIETVKSNWNKNLNVIFQPHLFSRTKEFYKDFAKALMIADNVMITEIFGSREKEDNSTTSDLIINEMLKLNHKNVSYVSSKDIVEEVKSRGVKGDIFLTMGAGNIWRYAEELGKHYND